MTSSDVPSNSIPDYAFYYCTTGATSVTLGEGITSVGEEAFTRASALTSVSLPSSLTALGTQSFYLSNLGGALTIPANVNSIGDEAFQGVDVRTQTRGHPGLPLVS